MSDLISAPEPGGALSSRRIAVALGYIGGLYAVWLGAWELMFLLAERFHWPLSSNAQVVYWMIMKVVLWIIPAALVMQYNGIDRRAALRGDGIRSILLWGATSLLLGAEVLVRKLLSGQAFSLSFSWVWLSTVLFTPFVEEFVFRGAVLGSLVKRYQFMWANIISSLLFVGAHLPGWYFNGVLIANLTKPIGGALSIFLLGLYFGYVVRRSRSILAGVVAHAVNNFFSLL